VNTILAVRENAQAEIDEAEGKIAEHQRQLGILMARVHLLKELLRVVGPGPAPAPVALPVATKPGLRIAR
jgi:hypothetical protein